MELLLNGFNVLSGSEILRGDKDILGEEVVLEYKGAKLKRFLSGILECTDPILRVL